MFTGIIEEVGDVAAVTHGGDDSAVLTVRAHTVAMDLRHGASIAVDGVCLTVVGWVDIRPGQGGSQPAPGQGDSKSAPDPGGSESAAGLRAIDFDVMGETLARSVIGTLEPGDRVNLERAVRADGRLDGHVVQGHVDGTGVVLARTPGRTWESVRIGVPPELAPCIAEKGAIAVDGVSLTVSAVGPDWFEVGLIPETLRATTLGATAVGARVNLEVDVLAKYVQRLLAVREAH